MHLFSKENIWSNPHSCNNNSMNRIISKEEEREDPRRDTSVYLRVQWCFHIPTRFLRIQCILQCSTRNPATTSNSTYRINSMYRINSSPRNTTTTRLIPCRSLQGILPATVPRVSKHSTRQNQTPSTPRIGRVEEEF